MRVSFNWLKDYVDMALSPDELCELLTMCGLEVEAIEPIGHSLEDILIARILSVSRHSEADNLFICQIDNGKETIPVVCSAPNLHEGALAPLALPGSKLPSGITVKEATIRGARSVGMLLAEDEMNLTDDHSGIMCLAPDLKPGGRLNEAMDLEDWAFEISITPNRPDCASVIGIAREIAALTNQKLKKPPITLKESDRSIDDLARVDIEDPVGCPRYAAGMIMGVKLEPSPFWMRYRLHASGVRAINNIVDVTNYVLLETGQPLHAFDYDRLAENRIVVRRAEEGQKFTTLDGQTRTLNNEHLMICDGGRAVALAGIMGGLNSEIFEGSQNVLVESAYFDPVTIRRGAKSLGISTEASYRFERGVDIEGAVPALQRSMMLISQLAGGEVLKGIIDQYPTHPEKIMIDLRVDKTNRFLGTSLGRETMSGYLKALEMEVKPLGDDVLRVSPPTFRVDLSREVDLMEEVARLEGYDEIPVTIPHIAPTEEGEGAELLLGDQIRQLMINLGFAEIISYSFISPDAIDWLGAEEGSYLNSSVQLLNPLTVDQSLMRTSLLPGILDAVKTNIAHGNQDLKLFEWGKIFLPREGEPLPHEKTILAAAMTGHCKQKEWYQEARDVDFYDIKGALEGLLDGLGSKGVLFRRAEGLPGYHPEVSATLHHSGALIGSVGQVAPQVLEKFDVKADKVFVFELDMEELSDRIQKTVKFQPFAKYPAVFRDISLVVDKSVAGAIIEEVIKREGGELIESARLFDIYEGEKIPASDKVLGFSICYRSKEGTLDGMEINRLHENIVEKIKQETGAKLRTG